MTLARTLLVAGVLAALAGCADEAAPVMVTETAAVAPANFVLRAEGQLRAEAATPLRVPGDGFGQRQLVWMVADGSPVKAGDVVARFGAEQTEVELEKALMDRERNRLARQAKEAELAMTAGRLDVDLAQVATDLAIAERYAEADVLAVARNTVLDAVADREFLGEKQAVLDWRQDQAQSRGAAELQVIGAQRASVDRQVATRERDLAALELRAPHDGVFVLTPNWSGEKPQIGAQMWAGNEFASLPDTAKLEVELNLPQLEAESLAVGQPVRLAPLGQPQQGLDAEIHWVASAARPVSRQNPIKYLAFKVKVPAEAARRHGWVPGQQFAAEVTLKQAGAVLTVPNLALRSEGGETVVDVWVDGGRQRRVVTLGVRGPARSEVLTGLAPGDTVVVAADAPATEPAAAPAEDDA
jgi:hypothetical protein